MQVIDCAVISVQITFADFPLCTKYLINVQLLMHNFVVLISNCTKRYIYIYINFSIWAMIIDLLNDILKVIPVIM